MSMFRIICRERKSFVSKEKGKKKSRLLEYFPTLRPSKFQSHFFKRSYLFLEK